MSESSTNISASKVEPVTKLFGLTAIELQQWAEGDVKALGRVLAEELGALVQLVNSQMSVAQRARFSPADVVQDAMVRLLSWRPQYAPKNRRQFLALIGPMLRQALIDLVRRDRIRLDQGRGMEDEVEFEHEDPQSIDPLSDLELQEFTNACLELLSPADRSLMELRRSGKSWVEIAEEVGSKPDTLRMRYKRAAERLGQNIEELRLLLDPDRDLTEL